MDNKIKAWGLSCLTLVSSWFGAKAQENSPAENASAEGVRVEVLATPSNLADKVDTLRIHTTPQVNKVENTSLRNQSKNEKRQTVADSIRELKNINLSLVDTVCMDSIALNNVEMTGFNQCRMDMLCLIAHWEDVKVRPYKLRGENFYTYGIGNTITENGTKVRKTDYIKDEAHLMQVFNNHIDEHIYPRMQEYLPLNSMTAGEICAIVSIAYNCGAKVISNIAPAVSEYCETRGDSIQHKRAAEKIKAFFMSRCKASGRVSSALKARRDFEFKIFTGEIVMKNNQECTAENEVDLYNSPIGAGYMAYKGNSREPEEICKKITECPYGSNLPDTIQSEINKIPPRTFKVNVGTKKSTGQIKVATRRNSRGR